jgi:hypothetical protein
MKNILVTLFVLISLNACAKNSEVINSVNNRTNESSQSANISTHSDKAEKSSKQKILDIYLGKEMPINKLNSIKKSINQPMMKIGEAGECGNFFDDETIYQLGNLGISANKDKAILTDVVNLPNNYLIHYDGLLINNSFKINQVNTSKFEITSEKATKEQKTYSIADNSKKYEYDIAYSIRNKNEDEILNLYYIKDRLVGVKILLQC